MLYNLKIQFNAPSGRTLEVTGDAPEALVIQDWLGAFGPNQIPLLLRCAIEQLALSSEWVTVVTDVDAEPDMEPFTGIAMYPDFRDERIVLSLEQFDQLWLAILLAIDANSPQPKPDWWADFAVALSAVRQRSQ